MFYKNLKIKNICFKSKSDERKKIYQLWKKWFLQLNHFKNKN